MSSTPETALSVVHQGACCCGAMMMADGTWNKLRGITDRIVSLVTFDPGLNETTLHQVSHGYCPECLRVARAELVEIQRHNEGAVRRLTIDKSVDIDLQR